MAESLSNPGKNTQRHWQLRLNICLDLASNHRSSAFGPDGHNHGVAINNRRGDELAVCKVINDVDLCTICMSNGRDAGVLNIILICGVEQDGAHRVTRLHCAFN